MRADRGLRVVVLGGALLLAASCGIAADDQPRFDPAGDVPFDLLGTTPPGTTAPAVPGGVATRVCLLGADQLVHPVERALPPGYELIELADLLTTGPTGAERSFGLTTALAEPGTVTGIDVQGGVATVDLDGALAARPVTDQLTVVAQLVCTLTEQPGVGQVRFTVERVPIAVPRGDGSSSSDPVSRQDYETLLAAP